jgi:hypothetical protein
MIDELKEIQRPLKNAIWIIGIGSIFTELSPWYFTLPSTISDLDFPQKGDTIGGITAPIIRLVPIKNH